VNAVVDRLSRGFDAISFRLGRQVPVVVFIYHSVHPDAQEGFGPWEYAVTPSRFERQVDAITDRYAVRPLGELVAAGRDGSVPTEPTAAVTFDDGFRDNLTEALPILDRYGAPATVFVAGKYLDGPPPYEYRLAAKISSTDHVTTTVGDTTVDRALRSRADRREAYEAIRRELKFERSDVRETVLEDIAGTTDGVPVMLTGEELRDLADSSLITVGAHGYEHVPLTAFDEAALARDVSQSRSTVESCLGSPVALFSYPYGAHDETVVGAVREAGFTAAVTTVPHRLPASRLVGSRFRIPRLDGSRHDVEG